MTLLSGVGNSLTHTLSRRRYRVKASRAVMSSLPDDRLPAKMGALADALRSASSDLARAQALVHLGDDWSQETGSAAAVEQGVRVPGCTAAVTVAVTLEPSLLHNELILQRVSGTADARLSQGLLALVARGLEGCTVSEALAVDAAALSTRAGLLSALTPSRSNGLASLVATLQGLVRAQQQAQLNASSVKETTPEAQGSAAAVATAGTLAQNVWSGAAPGTLVAAGSSPAEEVAVLLSGGVDSSVALRLVLEQGFKPRCFYLKIWLEDELAHLNK
jgi:sulfur transfer protein SufE